MACIIIYFSPAEFRCEQAEGPRLRLVETRVSLRQALTKTHLDSGAKPKSEDDMMRLDEFSFLVRGFSSLLSNYSRGCASRLFYSLLSMPLSRKKSCTQCRVAKVRCNLHFPSCSRCSQRALPCRYETSSAGESVTGRPSANTVGWTNDPSDNSASATIELAHSGYPEAPGCSKSAATEVQDAAMDTGLCDQEFIDNIPHMESSLTEVDCILPGSSPVDMSSFSAVPDARFDDMVSSHLASINKFLIILLKNDILNLEGNPSQNNSLQKILPTTMFASSRPTIIPRGFIMDNPNIQNNSSQAFSEIGDTTPQLREAVSLDAYFTAKSILGQIRSYPKMLVSGGTLPPFIHARCVVGDLKVDCVANGCHECLPKPLANCASLVHMFYSKTSTSSDFVWSAIYAEHTRLYKEVGYISY